MSVFILMHHVFPITASVVRSTLSFSGCLGIVVSSSPPRSPIRPIIAHRGVNWYTWQHDGDL